MAKESLKFIEEILHLIEQVKEVFNKKEVKWHALESFDAFLVSVFLHLEPYLEAIHLLASKNLGVQADIVVRSMFEMYVTVKFLKVKPEYIERYLEYDAYRRKCMLETLEQFGEKSFQDSEEAKVRRNEVIEAGNKAYEKHKFKKGKWYPPEFHSLEKICEQIGHREEYEKLYRFLSGYAHFNVASASSIDAQIIESTMEISYIASTTEEAVCLSSDLSSRILGFIDSSFSLGFQQKINDYQSRLLISS